VPIQAPAGWGDWRLPKNPWLEQLKIVTELTVQVNAQRNEMTIKRHGSGGSQRWVGGGPGGHFAKSLYLDSLEQDLDYYTQRLRELGHFS